MTSKHIETQIKKYGSEKAFRAEMSRRAKLRKRVGGGFAVNPALAKEAGSRGGKAGRGHKFAHGKIDPAVARAMSSKKGQNAEKQTTSENSPESQDIPPKEDIFTD